MTPAQVRERLRAVVKRGLARAAREEAEHLAKIRAGREPRRRPVTPYEAGRRP